MAEYLSPGVYVEEVPSLIKPIAGVSTSVAGFIGVVPDNARDDMAAISVVNQFIDKGDNTRTEFNLPPEHYPVVADQSTYQIRINGNATNAELKNDDTARIAKVTITGPTPKQDEVITGNYQRKFKPVPVAQVKLCTNFTEFKNSFGDFINDNDPLKNRLAHAVYGFFNNGGARCYVVRVNAENDIDDKFLERTFEPIDEIAIVAAPGITSGNVRSAIITHCQQKTQDRFAIFDSPETVDDINQLSQSSGDNSIRPRNSDYAAFYFPWIEVFDPATKKRVYVPPSGHIAGIYARVDINVGVHKAPANEVVLGALGLKYKISKNQQAGLNPKGVNCIRDLNGNFLVWGARTIGGDDNFDLKYINVRRTLLFLRESIDEGTQWVVFEPNTPNLWKRITRNVSDFLTTVWRSGALFGDTAQQAFYVKCDAETNPPEERELGRVVTEIGVAIVRPAEFVIFRISQITPLTNG